MKRDTIRWLTLTLTLPLFAAACTHLSSGSVESKVVPAGTGSPVIANGSTIQIARADPIRIVAGPMDDATRRVADEGTAPGPELQSIHFEYDRFEISDEGLKVLQRHARYLRAHPDDRVRVEGNADERGSAEYNLALGTKRAEAVRSALTMLGIPRGRIDAMSNGEMLPRASGSDEQSWAENRRADLVYSHP